MIPRISDRKIITYGFSPQADVRGVNVETSGDGVGFDVVVTDRKLDRNRTIEGLRLPMFGAHNAQNALAAVALAEEMGIADTVVRRALAGFAGVKRRFTKTGTVDGITVIDDYGHHPVEIAAVLDAARSATGGKVIAIVQPHRYSRLRDLFEGFCTCFNNADAVLVADVYPAGENLIKGINRETLVEGLRSRGHRQVLVLERPEDLASMIDDLASEGDYVVFLGAGSITAWANALPGELTRLRADKATIRRGAEG